MAELAIASGIAGLICLTTEIVKITCAYTIDLASAERTVLDYLVALRSLEAVLTQLGSLTEADRLKQLLADRPQALSTAVIRHCQSHLTQTQNKLKKRISEDGHIKLRSALCWPLNKKATQDSIRALQQYRDTFHAALSIDILAVSVATHEEVRISKEQDTRDKILQWLTPYNIQPTLQSLSRSRHPGTCQWIFDHDTFKQWAINIEIVAIPREQPAAQLLWCHGDPGSGKTILSGAIVEHLSGAATTLCHFFDHQTLEMGTPEALMRNLIKQFASQQVAIDPKILSIYSDAQKDARVDGTTIGRLLEIFESLCQQSTDLFVIIDALDECDNRRQLVQLFFSLTKAGAKVLVTSRTIPDLADAFKACGQLEIRASDIDLEAYILYQLDQLDEDLKDCLPVGLRASLCSTILERSSGLFLLCSLIMHDLLSSYNIAQVWKSLHKVPCNLSAMYQKTTNQILAQAEQDLPRAILALRILSWVAHGVRPFHIDELRHALATENADADLNRENLTSSRIIISVCRGLMKIDDQGYCRFIHLTAYDFFRNHARFASDDVNLDIASTCLTYLSFKQFADSSCRDQSSLERRLKEYSFILYAGHFLGHHARTVEDKLVAELLSFLHNSVLRSSFTQVRYFRNWKDKSLLDQSFARLPTGQSALQIACGLGLVYSAKTLLNLGEDMTAADDQGWTPLHAAASDGWTEILELLINQGVDIEKADNEGWTPLFWGVIKGHVETTRLLLRSNASMEARDKSGWTPVDWAAYTGNERIIRLLQPEFNIVKVDRVSKRAEVGMRDTAIAKKLRPFSLAAEQKSGQVFHAMLDYNTKVEYPQSQRMFGMPEAKARAKAIYAFLSKAELCRYAWKVNPHVNSICLPESFLVRLLDTAIKTDHLDMVKMILERGVDLSTRAYGEVKCRSALHTAAFCNDPRIPALLIEHGADPCEEDIDGHSPLYLASANGKNPVYRELLQAAQNRYGKLVSVPVTKSAVGDQRTASAQLLNTT